MQGLEGVRVLELGNMVSAAYAAKLMADLGAEVIKVEEPHGDLARQRGPFPGGTPHPEKSGLYLALNTNKFHGPARQNCEVSQRRRPVKLAG